MNSEPAASTPGRGRPSYGFDAPYVPIALGVAAVAFIVAGALTSGLVLVIIGVIFAIETGVYLHTTRRGKFRVWQRLLDELELSGDEQLLDVGCGRGAVLVAAAKRLHGGAAHGVDLWRSVDQSGNDEAMTRANAVAEGVDDRVELHTANMTQLPFDDASFDVVTSSIAIHNLRDAGDRAKAIDEAVRVLRSGGRLVVVDIRATKEYAARLEADGMHDVTTHSLGPNFWFSGPWQAASVVTARKA